MVFLYQLTPMTQLPAPKPRKTETDDEALTRAFPPSVVLHALAAIAAPPDYATAPAARAAAAFLERYFKAYCPSRARGSRP